MKNMYTDKAFTLSLTQERIVSNKSVLLQGGEDASIHKVYSKEFKSALEAYKDHAKKVITKHLHLPSNNQSYDVIFRGFRINSESLHPKTSIILVLNIVGGFLGPGIINFSRYKEFTSSAVEELIDVLNRGLKTVIQNNANLEVTSLCCEYECSPMCLKFVIQKQDDTVFTDFEENELVKAVKEDSVTYNYSELRTCLSKVGLAVGLKVAFPCYHPYKQVFVTTNIICTDESQNLEDLENNFDWIRSQLEVFSVVFNNMQRSTVDENVQNDLNPVIKVEGSPPAHPLATLENPSAEKNLFVFGKKIERCIGLIVVDIQNDFISGSLALRNAPAKEDGEEVVPVINKLLSQYEFDLVIYTQDWHPPDHCSFITNVGKYKIHSCSKNTMENVKVFDQVVYDGDPIIVQDMWPPHCIQGSHGAKFHKDLNIVKNSIILQKGMDPSIDSYSAFWDNARKSQSKLKSILESHNITTVVVAGLATDYCVGATSIHAAEFGFDTYMVEDACRGIHPAEIRIRTEQMQRKGVKFIFSHEVPRKQSPWLRFPPLSPGGDSGYTEDSVTIKALLENFIIFKTMEEYLNIQDCECNWFKFGHELSKVVKIPDKYVARLRNRERAGGGNPAEELFHNMKAKLPELTIVEFKSKIEECQRVDIVKYIGESKLPNLFAELSLDHIENLTSLLNTKAGPGWDILAAKLGYTTSDIDLIRSVSIQSGFTYSPTGCLLRKLLQVSPDVKVSVLTNAARRIHRNDVATFLTDNIIALNEQRFFSKNRGQTF